MSDPVIRGDDGRADIVTVGHVVDQDDGRVMVTGWWMTGGPEFDPYDSERFCGWPIDVLRAISASYHRRN